MWQYQKAVKQLRMQNKIQCQKEKYAEQKKRERKTEQT